MKRLSRCHWRVQTRTPTGAWITRCWSTLFLGAVAAAEGYADDLGAVARVVLGDAEWYRTEAR